jgi:glycosyltransferase involved in cell wall biosynthesis
VVDNWESSDIVLIANTTVTKREEIELAIRNGKKIIMRVDNIPRNSRNKGTSYSRLIDYAKVANWIIFQSEWAKDYAGWWFEQNGVKLEGKSSVIYNGIDPKYFYETDDKSGGSRITDTKSGYEIYEINTKPVGYENRYLFVQYNRDENKRFPEACYNFHQIYRRNPKAEFWIVGQYSPELCQYNFDFFAGEKVTYLGVIDNEEQMGEIYRNCKYLFFPAYIDASPNTVLEAISCGCEILNVNEIGGTKEVLNYKGRTMNQMVEEYKQVFEKV